MIPSTLRRRALGTPLKNEEVDQALTSLKGWSRDGKELVRSFEFDGFSAAIKFVNRIAQLAEEANHHPDILINYNKVKLTLSSHDSGGITQRDVRMATAINGISN
jgi:4a-hydroxytetrahydrobiopterin dehydratase